MKYVSIEKLSHFKDKLLEILALKTDIPTKTSQLTNDSGFKTTDNNTTYSLSKSGSTITLTASDGTTSSVTDSNTTYSVATTSANGLMSNSDKTKLNGIATGATKVTIDSALSSTSTNPVQNKVINSALENKANTSDLSTVATSGSYNDLSNKPTIPTVTNDLTNALKANYDTAYTHSQSTHAPTNAQANVIESIKVNGTAQTITSKAVNITVPTKTSDLTNDSDYMVKSQYDSDGDGQVEKADLAESATKLATARTITIGRQSNSFDGTANKKYTPESIFEAYSITSTGNATYTDKYAKIGTITVTSTYQNFYAVLQLYDVESGNFGGLLYVRFRSSSSTTTYGSYPIVSWLGMTPSGDYMNRVYITQDSDDKTKYYVYIKLSSQNHRTLNYRVLINVGSITFSSVSSSAFTDSMIGKIVVTSSVAYALSSHTHSNATTNANGFMSSSDKTKLDGIATDANNYTLPTATSSVLGGVKIGSNITNSSGTISVTKDDVINALGYTPGASTITVDSELSSTSTNPVQNKVIYAEIDDLKKFVSDGKTLVANAITEKGVETAIDDTFSNMATNILNISTGACVTTKISNFGLMGGSTVTKSTDVPIGTYGYIQVTGSCGNTSAVNPSNCKVTIMDGSTTLGSGTFTRARYSTASFTVRIAKQFTTSNNISVKFYNNDYNNWSNISIYYVKL